MVGVAWAGTVVFGGSLIYFAYFYGVVLARPVLGTPSDAILPSVLDFALFSVFALHHSVMARPWAKTWLTRHLPPAIERSIYVWISSALFVAVCLLWQPVPGVAWDVSGPLRRVLQVVWLAGGLLSLYVVVAVDALELTGIRQARSEERPVVFRAAGPFGLVRHPMYLGWLLLVFSVPSMTMSRLVFAIVSSAYLVIAIPFEERSLAARFDELYRDYQRKVRWRLVPGVW